MKSQSDIIWFIDFMHNPLESCLPNIVVMNYSAANINQWEYTKPIEAYTLYASVQKNTTPATCTLFLYFQHLSFVK